MTPQNPDPYKKGVYEARDRSDFLRFPYMRLAGGVITNAISDLGDKDILNSLDALLWFLSGDCAIYFESLDMVSDVDFIFKRLVHAEFKNPTQTRIKRDVQ